MYYVQRLVKNPRWTNLKRNFNIVKRRPRNTATSEQTRSLKIKLSIQHNEEQEMCNWYKLRRNPT